MLGRHHKTMKNGMTSGPHKGFKRVVPTPTPIPPNPTRSRSRLRQYLQLKGTRHSPEILRYPPPFCSASARTPFASNSTEASSWRLSDKRFQKKWQKAGSLAQFLIFFFFSSTNNNAAVEKTENNKWWGDEKTSEKWHGCEGSANGALFRSLHEWQSL